MYAKPIRRLSFKRRQEAIIEASNFADEIGHEFSHIEKDLSSWCAVYNCADGDEVGASVVICPNCGGTQVCYGEYGDPAIENCICSECNKSYQTEPF
jgi:hypothetical protein